MADKIVSIGFLSQRDLDVLGQGFRRHFPIADDGKFDNLIEKLDQVSQHMPANTTDPQKE